MRTVLIFAVVVVAGAPRQAAADIWVACASERGICVFGGDHEVRYGVAGKQVTRTFHDAVACTNDAFGNDPAPGKIKACEVSMPETWAACAPEGGACAITGTHDVRYGADGRFIVKRLSGTVTCGNAVFSDPIPGVVKACEILQDDYWAPCAVENETCAFSGRRDVRFGANGVYATKTLTDTTECNNATFGDPIAGVLKSCAVKLTVTATPPAATHGPRAPAKKRGRRSAPARPRRPAAR